MQYRVAFDPQLELPAAEFVAAWNASEHADAAPAAVDQAPSATFLSPEMTVALISAAASIPTAVIANFVSDYLKKKFLDRDVPRVTVTAISASDGQPVWIVQQRDT